MTLTTDHVQVPETASSASSPGPSHRSRRTVAGWVAVAAAVVASGSLAVAVLRTDDEGPSQPNSLTDRGSVNAIEHRTGAASGGQSTPFAASGSATNSLVDGGSVNAIEHRTGAASGGQSTPFAASGSVTNSLVDGGSVNAIEHRTEAVARGASSLPAAPGSVTNSLVDRGSVNAIEHRAEQATEG